MRLQFQEELLMRGDQELEKMEIIMPIFATWMVIRLQQKVF